MPKTVLSMTVKLPPHNENQLDPDCLRGSDEDYFVKRMKKHTPHLCDDGHNGGDFGSLKPTRYANVRKTKRTGK
jgi:hypothetical protein